MDIKSNAKYPLNILSNFAVHIFQVDSITCYSMEGFLQSLKFKDINRQADVCKMVGYKAKMIGSVIKWQKNQVLYWLGKEIRRDSKEYQDLLDKAFNEIYNNCISFREALSLTIGNELTHKIGRKDIKETILTEQEFISRLYKLRENNKI